MRVRLQKDWEWVRDYLILADNLLPNINKLKLISFRKSPKGSVTRTEGITIEYVTSKTYHIRIHTTYNKIMNLRDKSTSEMPFSIIDILTTLAHELAHLSHWDHTPEHKVLECKILKKFMLRLKRDGYISEEVELD